MANLRAIRNRIRSVKSTQKITKAMKMVAAARLRRAQERVTQSTPYQQKIEQLFSRLTQATTDHPLMQSRPVQKRLLIVISSDRGLCGAFNTNLLRTVMRDIQQSTVSTMVLPIGKRAASFFANRKVSVFESLRTFWPTFDHAHSLEQTKKWMDLYIHQEFDEISVYYNKFLSVMNQQPTKMQLLPISSTSTEVEETNYTFKPDEKTILRTLVPRAVDIRFFVAALNSQAGEFGARMTAMDSATRNAGDMIEDLTLNMNRVRQAAITNELVEIISGAEAIQ